MAGIGEIIGSVLIVLGAFFYVVGAIGIYRMPDVFTRMHAAGISDTAGAGLLIAGMVCLAGISLVTVKLVIILVVILVTSPIATHALAQAALHAGLEPILASKKVLIGPGAHAEPARTHKTAKAAPKKAAKPSAKKRRSQS